jgi:hypothetical protein
MVTRAAEQYRDATVTAFVSVLVHRQVAAQLRYVMSIPDGDFRMDHRPSGAQPPGNSVAALSSRSSVSFGA